MATLRQFLDRQRAMFFEPGRPLEGLAPLFIAFDGAFFTSGEVTHGAPHVRDGMSRQRINFIVLAALSPIALWAMFNVGYSAAIGAETGIRIPNTWQERFFAAAGWRHDDSSVAGCLFFGFLMYAPVVLLAAAVAAGFEAIVALIRQRAPRGEYLIDAILFSLILSPASSLSWVVIGMASGFAFTGPLREWARRGSSPAVVGWFVLWLVDPWTFDLHTATFAEMSQFRDYWNAAFVMGTSTALGVAGTLLLIFCAAATIMAGVRSWRPFWACMLVAVVLAVIDSMLRDDSPSTLWRLMASGPFAFGAGFFLTDPFASPLTNRGRLLSGAIFPVLFVLLRWLTHSSVEATMLSVLVVGWMAPALDEIVVELNVRWRQPRYVDRT